MHKSAPVNRSYPRKSVFSRIACAFGDHPRSAGETYWQHLFYTARTAAKLFYIGGVIFMHGLFPFLFVYTGSRELEKLFNVLQERKAQSLKAASGREEE